MLINCFCAAGGNPVAEIDDDRPQAPRPTVVSHHRKSSRFMKRQSSDGSRISSTSSKSTQSNESISKLPPCKRESDPKIEAMMMPFPENHRPSKCLRLSYPKTYSDIVSDMKAAKGCRDWRNFAVFYDDEVDMSITADEKARRKALEHQRTVKQLNCTFRWCDASDEPIGVDMIGGASPVAY